MTARLVWASELVARELAARERGAPGAAKAGARVLEVGCGAGALAELLLGLPKVAHVTAIDRSAHAASVTAKRPAVAKAIEADRATVEASTLEAWRGRYDVLVAFDVNDFLKAPEETIRGAARLLRPRARLALFFQPPFDATAAFVDDLTATIASSRAFTRLRTKTAKPGRTTAFAVMATRSAVH